ncbi:hypothetical protein AKJ09_03403 [Labilithrix luteola]|uniref:Lipoprotein n=1 Tax=Labilithrix luteola TaxID=1391654 RepID=A0A0K1PUF1_9BACT|nr:hypothetical protein [Labilithrix luteola]AKU96739.1 hypothetical protein AKJ09_03403 [Labilithrix luteola]
MKSLRTGSAVAFLALTTSAAACGDLYADPIPTTPPAAGSPVVGIPEDPQVSNPVDTRAACGTLRPKSNDPCVNVGQTCEYGTSPDSRCNELLVCEQTTGGPGWFARPWNACSRSLCPDGGRVANLDGTPCTLDAGAGASDADELVCPMSDGFCACTTGPDAAHAHERRWSCQKPDPGCPTQRPLVGQSCFRADLTCDYGSCVFKEGRRMTCNGRRWDTGDSSCNE